MKAHRSKLCLVLYDSVGAFGLQGVSGSAVHLVKLFGDLQRRLVLGLRDVEPHKQAAAHAEEDEYEEAEALQTLLLGDFIKRGRKRERGRAYFSQCVIYCVSLFQLFPAGSPPGWGRPSPPRTGSSSSACRPPCIQPICTTGLIFLQESESWLQLE